MAQEVQREQVAIRDGREQLPLGRCPGNCSFAGACLKATESAAEPPACRCLGCLTVSLQLELETERFSVIELVNEVLA